MDGRDKPAVLGVDSFLAVEDQKLGFAGRELHLILGTVVHCQVQEELELERDASKVINYFNDHNDVLTTK